MKYACVTGAERGLGFELTRQLIEDGYTVFAGRFLAEWRDLDELYNKVGDRLIIIPLDVRNDLSVRAAHQMISSRTDRIEMLVNNAAVIGKVTVNGGTILDELDFADMLNTIDVIAIGSLRMTQALMPLILKSDKKLVVNISSEAGSIGQSWRSNMFGYCMGKAAMNMHSTIVYNKIKDLGGHVLNLHPGWMKSWMSGHYRDNADLTPEYAAAKLMDIIRRFRTYQTNQPAYLDYLGNRLQW